MYSNQDLAQIHFMYGKADGNAALARRLYQKRYPQRQCPDRNTFVCLHYRMCEYGKFNSPDRWIGRGGPIAWPPRSPELNPLDFYLWGHLKSLVYSSPVPDLESLRNRIVACSEDIRNVPGVWDRVRRSMRHRCYWDLVIKEAIEIQLDGNNFNRDGGLQLSTAWKPAINTLRPPAHGRQSGPASGS
ncbi:hypothetical protein ANN_08649 [Periplaneta americana]|uniref:DUF4817 domain-containing protein n=1 Tax=Periplaneta americana TaxID=6978 RepID=A0ABQ8T3G6_PERAM|nr:hypothetical protein ANN_08649 [Periplaneta americana]